MHNTASNLPHPLSVVVYIVAWPGVSSLVRFCPNCHRGWLSLWSHIFLSRTREFEALHVRRSLVPVRPIRAFAPHPSGFACARVRPPLLVTSSSPQSSLDLCPLQLAPYLISSSFRASARNLKSRVKAESAAWCSPSARQKA
jgi:hypothetical protein